MKFSAVLIISVFTVGLFSCKTEEITLHGDVSGIVTDVITNHPIPSAVVKLNPSDISSVSGPDGSYLIKSLTPQGYEISAIKSGYGTYTKFVNMGSAETQIIDFQLNPLPKISAPGLDFGSGSTSLSFTISNPSANILSFIITTSRNWINVLPRSGDITNGTVTITATIDRSGLTDNIIKEAINIAVYSKAGIIGNIPVGVYLNGVMDKDGNYYRTVKIVNQIWMAENLKTGIPVDNKQDQTDNGIVEKYVGSEVFGGYYQWNEMMQYKPSDNKPVGTTQGVCPVGWHVPTISEWNTLFTNVGGTSVAGKKLKEMGFSHWSPFNAPGSGIYPSDNEGTDDYGFTALPGGSRSLDGLIRRVGSYNGDRDRGNGNWWTSTENSGEYAAGFRMYGAAILVSGSGGLKKMGYSVRCVKD